MEEVEILIDEKPQGGPTVVRNATDLQRLKLEKLMKNPEKPIIIPEKTKERGMPAVPEFVRNVMGSSAGAGSGEFHVYRHLRRKEYARQRYMKEKGERERLDNEYHQKLDDNKRKAQEKTAKKRAKRQKQKGKMKNKSRVPKTNKNYSSGSEQSSSEEEQTVIKKEGNDYEDKCNNEACTSINYISEKDNISETDFEAVIKTESVSKENDIEREVDGDGIEDENVNQCIEANNKF